MIKGAIMTRVLKPFRRRAGKVEAGDRPRPPDEL